MAQKLKVEIFVIHVFLHKIGCASAIQTSLIAFGLHYFCIKNI